jgi:protein Mpv17
MTGPILHFWYGALANFRFLAPLSAGPKAFTMMALDQVAFAPIMLSWMLYSIAYLETFEIDRGVRVVKSTLWETLLANWKIWPFASLFNFYIVPPHYRVLFGNGVGLVWNTIMSYIAHKN